LRVLLTGHLGYLGARLVPMLRASEIEVVGLDNGLFRGCAIAAPDAVPAIEKDIRDVEAADVDGFDAIIHLAGLSGEAIGHVHPAITFEVNFEAALRLAQLARQCGVRRFLFASSTAVYGSGKARRNESAPLTPESPYAVSKALAEAELRRLGGVGFCPVFLRAAEAYGVSPVMRFEPVLNRLVADAAISGCMQLEQREGPRLYDLVHVEDLARAFLAALVAPEEAVHLQAFNVGAPGETYSVQELASFVRETVPGATVAAQEEGVQPQDHAIAHFGKIVRVLTEYRPRWTARRGTVEIFETVRRLGLRRGDVRGARFGRADHLKMLVRLGRMDEELRLVSKSSLSIASSAR
jgi:nucleoside-diphosphate-sugar epimerase